MTRLFITVFCGSIFLASCSYTPSSQLTSQSQQDTNGIALYEEYCASCHRHYAQTTKPRRNASRLRSAIKVFPAMRDLDFLSDAQLEAISAALSTINLQQVSRDN